VSLPVARTEPAALILVVDDDRRVRELLEIALGANGYRVITAADGDEAVKKALGERPDLIVLDVRLPKRSGLEVCETLRTEAHDVQVPIVLVSAAAENETRLMGFSRGADDYLVKPFSPRELLARVKRLLARTQELKQARERLAAIERELDRATQESRRVHLEAERAERLRHLALHLGAELHRTRDLERLAQRLLHAAQSQTESPTIALLVRDGTGLVPCAVLGDLFDRAARLEVAGGGALATMLTGLARPVYRHQLEQFPELDAELHDFAAARLDLLAPVRGEQGLEALLAFEEPRSLVMPSRSGLESLEALCSIASVAVANAVRDRERAAQSVEFAFGPAGAAAREASEVLARAARHVPLPPRMARIVRIAVGVGRGAASGAGPATLERLAALDPTEFARDLALVVDRAARCPAGGEETEAGATDDVARAAALAELGWRIAEAMAAGAPLAQAAARAQSDSPTLATALRRAFDEALENAPEDVRIDMRARQAR